MKELLIILVSSAIVNNVVLSQFLGAEIAFDHSGEHEFFLFHQIAVLIIHSGSSLKTVMVADGQAAI